jgi:hypothetical protein
MLPAIMATANMLVSRRSRASVTGTSAETTADERPSPSGGPVQRVLLARQGSSFRQSKTPKARAEETDLACSGCSSERHLRVAILSPGRD